MTDTYNPSSPVIAEYLARFSGAYADRLVVIINAVDFGPEDAPADLRACHDRVVDGLIVWLEDGAVEDGDADYWTDVLKLMADAGELSDFDVERIVAATAREMPDLEDRFQTTMAVYRPRPLPDVSGLPEYVQLAQAWTAWDNGVDLDQVVEEWDEWQTPKATERAMEFIALADALARIRKAGK